ncbi:MAG: class I SAM-dependent methyltransferase [Clostridia bacterium]
MEIKLSPRLRMIAESIKPCMTAWDVGSDHAHIPIYLVQKGICEKAFATDVREGPIAISEKNIVRHGLSEEIICRMGDGLEVVDDPDCIILAGMGGILIRELLLKQEETASKARQLILQAMTHQEDLRKYLFDSGYDIYHEDLCMEKQRIYNVICTRYTGICTAYEEYELFSSKILTKEPHPLLKEYLAPKIKRLNNMTRETADPLLVSLKTRLEGL